MAFPWVEDDVEFLAFGGFDQPEVREIYTCPEAAREAIHKKEIPLRAIHDCSTSKRRITDVGPVIIVKIEHTAHDCPSGCFYSKYQGVYISEENTLIDIPIDHRSAGANACRSNYSKAATKQGISKKNKRVKSKKTKLFLHDGNWGWLYKCKSNICTDNNSMQSNQADAKCDEIYWTFCFLGEDGRPDCDLLP